MLPHVESTCGHCVAASAITSHETLGRALAYRKDNQVTIVTMTSVVFIDFNDPESHVTCANTLTVDPRMRSETPLLVEKIVSTIKNQMKQAVTASKATIHSKARH